MQPELDIVRIQAVMKRDKGDKLNGVDIDETLIGAVQEELAEVWKPKTLC